MAGTNRSDHFESSISTTWERATFACFLLTTPSGHILIDTALEQSAPILRENITSLGFKVSDIRIILSGHAHFDHVAGHADMKAASGAPSVRECCGCDGSRERRKEGLPSDRGLQTRQSRPNHQGQRYNVKLGKWTLTAHLTPGHTEGNTTWTTTINENGKKLNVVLPGACRSTRSA